MRCGVVINKRPINLGPSAGVALKSVVVVPAVRIVDGLIALPVIVEIKAGRIGFPDDRILQISRHVAAVVVAVIVAGFAGAVRDIRPVIAIGGVIDIVVNALLIGSPIDAAVVGVVGGRGDA